MSTVTERTAAARSDHTQPAAPAHREPLAADVVVIGAGTGGLGAARAARRARRRVVLIEAARPGGDCTWWGCVPSKTLIETARAVHRARTGADRGIRGEVSVDFAAAMDRVHATIEEVYGDESPAVLRRQGITLLAGRARFVDSHTVEVDGQRVTATYVVLATGARAAAPPVPGLADVAHLTNETVWELRELPTHLLVLGGGPIGCELAQAFARLGSRVTLVQSGARLLPRDEPAAADLIAGVLRRDGVDVRLGAEVVEVSARQHGSADRAVLLRLADGGSVAGSHLFVATGRKASTDGLALSLPGVEVDERGYVRVDARLRTTARHVYAVGDCASSLAFTHVAEDQARLAVCNLLFAENPVGSLRQARLPASWDPSDVPWVTFTDPEVAHVGLTEAQAYERYGASALVARVPLGATDRARCAGETEGFVQLVAAPGPLRLKPLLRLVGMTAVAPSGGELLAQGSLAIRVGMPVGRIAQTIAPYPAWSLATRIAAALFFGGYGGLSARPARPT
jgi:pyruvate/2-oxoglutarate dehydrogenase complex dihydrolipoamide dehydrogenase (E3) component